jgi:thiol-disulfide isomerase/thioredoxin
LELNKFTKEESAACQYYYLSNVNSFANNEEIRNIFSEKQKTLNNKTLSFIKTNADLYYSLWVFNEEFAGSYSLGADTLLKFFHQVFPDSLKNTFEGREAVRKLNARINTSIGGEAPGFEVKDENGESIKLSALCGPCIKLMPELNKIRDRYSKNKLEIISILLDENRDAYQSALKKNNINCIHLNDSKFVQTYTIGPIPHMLLIDKDGVVIYNMMENDDYHLLKLKSILETISNE